MSGPAVIMMPISSVAMSARRRAARRDKVEQLAQSIKQLGLLNPITITQDGTLVAGLHRLEACKQLGWQEIPANVIHLDALHAELAEIDENLIRNELSELEQSVQLARRKEIHLALHPETKAGVAGGKASGASRRGEERTKPTVGFVQDSVAKTGQGKSTIKRKVQIGEALSDLAPRLMDTPVADSQKDLLALARMGEVEREAVIEKLESGEAKNVKVAIRQTRAEERDRAAAVLPPNGDAGENGATRNPKAGEFWRLGRHTLYCGDTSNRIFIERAPVAAFAFADPPYNAGVADWDNDFEWGHDWLIKRAEVVAVTPGIVSIFDFARATQMPYLWSVACWIDNGMTRGAMGFGNWLYAALFSKSTLHRGIQDHFRVSIKTSETDETEHKGRKPAEFVAWLIQHYSQAEELVIDPFLGSGTTLLVAETMGRTCYGGELDPTYCADIISRWERATGKKAEREE